MSIIYYIRDFSVDYHTRDFELINMLDNVKFHSMQKVHISCTGCIAVWGNNEK